MIIKKIPTKKQNKSSFKRLSSYILDIDNNNAKVLVEYMLDKNDQMDKVECYHFTNCSFENAKDNINEIINTQRLNTTTKQDKTLHLVVSFKEDEKPPLETLKTIEEEIAKSLGMQEHQRLSVVHSNTNNLHIHIAINKINPHTLKVINPYNDVKILQETAIKLEKQYNLKIDNHMPHNSKTSNKYNIHSMNCSFEAWVKEKLFNQVDSMLKDEKTTFEDIKKLLLDYDLEFKERRRGFVVSSKSERLFCKASSIHRDLSKQALGKRFKGLNLKQEIEDKQDIKEEKEKQEVKEQYQRPNKESSKALWEDYLRIENKKKQELDKELRMLKIRRNEFKTTIPVMKFSFQQVKNQRMIFKNEQKAIYQKYKRVSYREYLIKESLSGNEEATRVLRRSKVKINEEENTLSSTQEKPKIFENVDYITKEGYAVYKSGANKAIDKGEMLKVCLIPNSKDDKEFLLDSLLIAIDRFGNNLNITGDESFKRNVLDIVNEYNLNVSFADPQMQKIYEGNIDKRQELKARKILKNIIETKMKLIEQDSDIEEDIKEKELKALNFSLKKISDSTPSIFEGELKKLGFSYDEINSMDTQSVSIEIDGFLVNERNKEGLVAMNEEIKRILRDDEALKKFEKFEHLFSRTDKVVDVAKGFYANRKIDVNEYIEKFSMEESKINKVANAISMLSNKNLKIMEEFANRLEKDYKHQYLKKIQVIESNDINLSGF